MFNTFILAVEKKVQSRGLPLEQKQRILRKIVENTFSSDIFTPAGFSFLFDTDNDNDNAQYEAEALAAVEGNIVPLDMEERIRQKQLDLGISPDEDPTGVGESYTLRWGRSRLHEAVSMRDLASIRIFLQEGDDPGVKDNNNRTPYEMAIMQEQQDIIDLFKELHADI
tara:strand:- start:13597 stop:14100 length:504 start_codon:yes stop_codon:yes gene_type:complete